MCVCVCVCEVDNLLWYHAFLCIKRRKYSTTCYLLVEFYDIRTLVIIWYQILFILLSWRQHPTKQQLYGHLPPITKTIQVRRTRQLGHYWRSRDELKSDILLWTPSHGRAKTGRPARTYIQQLCADTGCSLENLPGAMDDRDGWCEVVKEIHACSVTRWWWWWFLNKTDNSS